MKSGWLGAMTAVLVAAAVASGADGALLVNGQLVSLSPAPRSVGSSMLVPVLAFAPFIGIEPLDRDGGIMLRWNGGCGELPSHALRLISDVAYTALDELLRFVGGTASRVDDDTFVDVAVAQLVEFSIDGEELRVRMDRFAPVSVVRSDGIDVIRLSNCRTDLAEMTVSFGPGGVGRATLVAVEGPACEVRVAYLEEAGLAIRRVVTDSSCAVILAPSETSSMVSSTAVGDGLSLFEGEVAVGETRASVAYVWIGAWRGRFDVAPILPPAGAGTEAPLSEAMSSVGAAVAISSRSHAEVGLVVIDGVPFSLDGDAPCLGFDVLGSLVQLVPDVVAYATTPSARIPVDGVNRSVGYGEVVAYPPGYTGYITRGFPDRFYVVRIRDGVIVSIQDQPFVVADPSAALLVAAGDARSRLDGLALGDLVRFECDVGPERGLVADALSIDGWMRWGGERIASCDPAKAWSLAGTDWQGGFFFCRVSGDGPLSLDDVASILTLLPTPARDAAVLERGGAAALALDVGSYHERWGIFDAISVSLGAIPK